MCAMGKTAIVSCQISFYPLYTDGITEARSSDRGFFGMDGLAGVLVKRSFTIARSFVSFSMTKRDFFSGFPQSR